MKQVFVVKLEPNDLLLRFLVFIEIKYFQSNINRDVHTISPIPPPQKNYRLYIPQINYKRKHLDQLCFIYLDYCRGRTLQAPYCNAARQMIIQIMERAENVSPVHKVIPNQHQGQIQENFSGCFPTENSLQIISLQKTQFYSLALQKRQQVPFLVNFLIGSRKSL